jgi:hypothetical protein
LTMFTHTAKEGVATCNPELQVIHPAINAITMTANVFQDSHGLAETDVTGSAGLRLTSAR